jgi:hypothetical protein
VDLLNEMKRTGSQVTDHPLAVALHVVGVVTDSVREVQARVGTRAHAARPGGEQSRDARVEPGGER